MKLLLKFFLIYEGKIYPKYKVSPRIKPKGFYAIIQTYVQSHKGRVRVISTSKQIQSRKQ